MRRGTESRGQFLRRMLGIRLGRFWQHAPCPIEPMLPPPEAHPSDMDWPTICCVTPSFNQGAFIADTIRSVLSQQYPRLQYVVQDAGSGDGTPEVLASFAPPVRFAIEADSGQADGINKGFARCDADIMGWLNADDILLPGALHHVAMHFMAHPEADVVYGDRLVIDAQGAVVGRWILPGHDPHVLRTIDYVPQETLYWRRRAWQRVGGALDVSKQFALDWDLLRRFDAAGCRIHHVPRLMGGFRVHPSQKTQANIEEGMAEMRGLRSSRTSGLPERIGMHARHAWFLARHLVAERRFQEGLRRRQPSRNTGASARS